jgi:hypothetical protein
MPTPVNTRCHKDKTRLKLNKKDRGTFQLNFNNYVVIVCGFLHLQMKCHKIKIFTNSSFEKSLGEHFNFMIIIMLSLIIIMLSLIIIIVCGFLHLQIRGVTKSKENPLGEHFSYIIIIMLSLITMSATYHKVKTRLKL